MDDLLVLPKKILYHSKKIKMFNFFSTHQN